MKTNLTQEKFNLIKYLPSDLICDMSISDTSEEELENSLEYNKTTSLKNSSPISNSEHFRFNMMQNIAYNNQMMGYPCGAMMGGFNYNYRVNSPTNASNNLNDDRLNLLISQMNEMRLRNRETEIVEKKRDSKKKKIDVKLSEFLKTQKGSRIYQRKLKKITSEEIDDLLKKLDGTLSDLITNIYSNYFCQKLFSACNSKQKKNFLENVN